MLKPQDIVILLKILSFLGGSEETRQSPLTQNKLAVLLCMSASEVNAGLKRLVQSGLLSPALTDKAKNRFSYVPNRSACEECLISGVPYFFPAQLGEYTRGIATAYAAPILEEHFLLGDDPIPVWPYGDGDQRGLSVPPLYGSVPKALTEFPDRALYDFLALIDAIRIGRVRERELAIKILKDRLYEK